jgi:hypothetical protein
MFGEALSDEDQKILRENGHLQPGEIAVKQGDAFYAIDLGTGSAEMRKAIRLLSIEGLNLKSARKLLRD